MIFGLHGNDNNVVVTSYLTVKAKSNFYTEFAVAEFAHKICTFAVYNVFQQGEVRRGSRVTAWRKNQSQYEPVNSIVTKFSSLPKKSFCNCSFGLSCTTSESGARFSNHLRTS